MKRTPLATAICLLLVRGTAFAPLFGSFPGLDGLIRDAEFILVAELVNAPQTEERDMGGGGVCEIQVLHVLKGDIKPDKKATAYLRDLPFGIASHSPSDLAFGLMPRSRYLLFLNKPGTHMNLDGKPAPAEFENENCEGDTVWIGSSESAAQYFDLALLKGKSVHDSVVTLLKHAATVQQQFASAVNAMIKSRATDQLTETITQVVWLDGNPEQAANFYLSIFKEARKDPNINQYTDVGVDSTMTFKGVRLWIDGQNIVLLNGGAKFKPNVQIGLTLNCDVQEEIDYYWDKLSAGGQKSHSGWLKDKFGIWWHVVPTDLPLLLGGKYGNSENVLNALSKMDKIDSAALERAAHPEAYKSDRR